MSSPSGRFSLDKKPQGYTSTSGASPRPASSGFGSGAQPTASPGKETKPSERLILKNPMKPTPVVVDLAKRPFGIEVAGIWDIGKTHLGCSFPGVAMIDTEKKGDIVASKFKGAKWFPCNNMGEVRQAVLTCINDPDIKTIMFDSGSDLTEYAAQEYCSETGKEKIFPVVLWAHVYERVDELTKLIRDAGKYIYATSRLKDEYVGDTKTGAFVRSGYNKFPYQLEIMLDLQYGIAVPQQDGSIKKFYTDRVFGRVVKNNIMGPDERKPWLFDVSFNGILSELLKPWDVKKNIVKEAENFLVSAKK